MVDLARGGMKGEAMEVAMRPLPCLDYFGGTAGEKDNVVWFVGWTCFV